MKTLTTTSQPKATALLYTTRSLGATLGVSVGGSVQLGALASQLKILFEGLEARDQVSIEVFQA